jgi:hypothetical protein
MKPRTRCATAGILATLFLALPACDRLGKPTEAEAGATRIERIAGEARALTRRLAGTESAIGTQVRNEDGSTREVEKPMLALPAAAEELRALASRAQSVGATDAQRKEAAALALRLRREAAMLDLMALEQTLGRMRALTGLVQAELTEAAVLEASAGPRSVATAEARVKATRTVLASFREQIAAQKSALEAESARLGQLETAAREAATRADSVDAEAQVLRSAAATSTPGAARPKVEAAVAKMNEARILRRQASETEIGANALRGAVGLAQTGARSAAEAEAWLASQLREAEAAEKAAKTRTETSLRAIQELRADASKRMEELQALATTEFKPQWDRLKEALDGNLGSKQPTDIALLAIAKARLYQMGAVAVDLTVTLAAAQGAPEAAMAPLAAGRAQMMAQVQAALVEARDALSGASSPGAEQLLASVEQIATETGVDLTRPVPAPSADAEPSAHPDADEGHAPEHATPGSGDASDAPAAPGSPDEPSK